MAFHTACPITCRKICFCPHGFPKGKNEFFGDVTKLEEFLKDPWGLKAKQPATIQVKVPKLNVAPPPQAPVGDGGGGSGGDGEEAAAIASAQTKRVALQKKAAAASMVAEDFARRFESGDVEGSMKDVGGEEQGLSNVKVMCRLCFSGENEGGERARKMMSCKSCAKKYHRNCLKAWGQHRDLFHWSSWTCPSCRLCEGCRRTGDPNKFMFCKRCDAAYHCYCMQPPHKNVSSGPYLCPKHTKCHSCSSNVPGNGLSVRWFLGYTCCDACGRLFVKGNYCPVCLKVYRDSESTPMVCCDICQRWAHCQCDGISDEKYLQFQVNGNLPYSCPKCRGYSYQSINRENAVQELWRRRDLADRDLIASLRAGAGLPVEDEMFSISPFSDDEDTAPVVKNEHKKSLKFSRKGLVDKSPQKSKDYGKKSGKGKGLTGQNEGHPDAPSGGYSAGDVKNDELQAYGELDSFSSPAASLTEGICSFNMAGVIKHKFIDEVAGNTGKRTVQRKGSKPQRLDGDDVGIQTSMPKTSKEPKGVIHLGSLDKNIAGSPKSDASSCQKEQVLTTSHGYKDLVQLRENENSERNETAATLGGGKESNLIEITKVSSEATHFPAKVGGKFADGSRPYPQLKTSGYEDLVQLRENENSERNETAAILGGGKESTLIKIKKVSSKATHFPAKVGGKFADGSGPYPPLKTSGYEDLVQLREKENSERNETAATLAGGKGHEDLVQLREKENSERNETAATLGGGKESNLTKIKKVSAEATHFPAKVGGKFADGSGPYPPLKTSGNEDLVQLRENENSERNETAATLGGGKESNLIKIKKVSAEATHFPAKVGGKFADGSGPYPPLKTSGILGKRSNDSSVITKAGSEVPATRDNKLASVKHVKAWLASCDELNEEKNGSPSLSNLPRMDPRPLQRPKFKNPYHESQNSLASPGEEEKSMDKGHESKRMRSPAFEEKASTRSDDNSSRRYEDIDDFLADKWILQKLGQNAKGKRVEFHHLFDNTWHRGTVVEVFEGSSVVSVALDDGNMKKLELGKQGIRLISSKQNC
ncbi:uncharacterized protein [Solanum tuberosum]|uniref:uncharacterized protein isoform X1 n=1 Tax=Solanum tuberosum TaxID=4113 RepID=UPI00073A1919|nr:PREDICTED: uncharacterized protein LOC102586916 isoform X1 [Solanum tuberosum]